MAEKSGLELASDEAEHFGWPGIKHVGVYEMAEGAPEFTAEVDITPERFREELMGLVLSLNVRVANLERRLNHLGDFAPIPNGLMEKLVQGRQADDPDSA